VYLGRRTLLYRRYDNSSVNSVRSRPYLASLFLDLAKIRRLEEPLAQPEQLLAGAYQGKGPRFDSNFESGNLLFAFKGDRPNEYDLVLQNDINSKGFTQWFYFSVSEVPPGVTLRFNILNLAKADSLFNYGLLPAVYSERKEKKASVGWHRAGKAITYQRSSLRREDSRRYYYQLSFSY
jgi:hypothetical protein